MDGNLEEARALIQQAYGFVTNPDRTSWENVIQVVREMSVRDLSMQVENMKTHNLCRTLTPSAGFKELLGLGLKFCIKKKLPPDDSDYTMA